MLWGGTFDIDRKKIEVIEEEEKTQAPNFWDDSKAAEKILKDIQSKKKWVLDFDIAVDALADLEVLFDFHKLGEASEEEVEEPNWELRNLVLNWVAAATVVCIVALFLVKPASMTFYEFSRFLLKMDVIESNYEMPPAP